MRISAVLTAASMVILAASFGVVVYLALGFSFLEALASALTLLTVLVTYNTFAGRARDRADVSSRVADLSRGTADLARQVGDIGRRVVALEQAVAKSTQKSRAATEPLSAEIQELATLVNQLAESVAAHEVALVGAVKATATLQPSGQAAAAAPPPVTGLAPELFGAAPAAAPPVAAAAPPVADHGTPPQTLRVIGGRFHGMAREDLVRILRAALEANRLDVHLQPIVTLPQRKVRYYEALARLRTEDGELIAPADFLGTAEAGGLMPMLDHLMLFRSMQVVRRLSAKNREAGVFCNIAGATLADPEFFPQLFDFLTANRAVAPSLVLEFSQRAWRAFGPQEQGRLDELAKLGFRFSLDRVADLDLTPQALAAQSFRFIKVPAALLLDRAAATSADIDIADLSSLLGRFGIDLIAEKIETEAAVVDILDYDVRLGQGFLFSPPRPMRAEGPHSATEPAVASAAPAQPAPSAAPPAAPAPPAPPVTEPARPVAAPSPAPAAARGNTVLAQIAQEMARRA
jgi:cyclic-di-GMP phosphodiesterase TipF (flagellum assembly factor)